MLLVYLCFPMRGQFLKQFQGCERIQEQIFLLELVQGVKLSNQFTLRSEKQQSEVQDSDSDGQKKIRTADFVG